MFRILLALTINHFSTAIRNLNNNKVNAVVNIGGLALGLAIFLLTHIIVSYENNHDNSFVNRDRIYSISSQYSPNSGMPISEYPSIRSAYGPLFESQIDGLDKVARVITREVVVGTDANNQLMNIRFTDNSFNRIFNFDYLYGSEAAIDDPNALIVSASTAQLLFGRINVLGKKITIEASHNMYIGAVIENVQADSHFNSDFRPEFAFTAFSSLDALEKIAGFDKAGQWDNEFDFDSTYILLSELKDRDYLQSQIKVIYDRYAPEGEKYLISGLIAHPLVEANTLVWQAMGFPLLEAVKILGLLVLITACVNYSNLAIAQNFYRTHEIGLRKSLGATQTQLIFQFLMEGVVSIILAMLLAVASVELILPLVNNMSNKAIIIQYSSLAPTLLILVLVISVITNAYPAYLISRVNPVNSLHSAFLKSKKGSVIRSVMIAVQFSISIFLLALVLIVYFQNNIVKSLSDAYKRSDIIVFERTDRVTVDKSDLTKQLLDITGVESVTYSSSVPYTGLSGVLQVKSKHDNDLSAFEIFTVSVDEKFMASYEIPLLAEQTSMQTNSTHVGNPQRNNTQILPITVKVKKVIINEFAAELLGYEIDTVIGKTILNQAVQGNDQTTAPSSFAIVGLMPDQYFLGPHMSLKPLMFILDEGNLPFMSIKIDAESRVDMLLKIDAVWANATDNYPVTRNFLEKYFNFFYSLLMGINIGLAAFTGVSLTLALMGLFGLSAVLTQYKTKEIAIRKIMGASTRQIVVLLIWQFSKPVIWSFIVAIPAAYFASDIYLQFFPVPLENTLLIILLASCIGFILSCSILAYHAFKISHDSPSRSLRHE